jgi:hypothetical protein
LGILALSILWPLHHFFGVGESIYELAIAAGLLYGGVIVVTFAIAGLVWGGIKLFGLEFSSKPMCVHRALLWLTVGAVAKNENS